MMEGRSSFDCPVCFESLTDTVDCDACHGVFCEVSWGVGLASKG